MPQRDAHAPALPSSPLSGSSPARCSLPATYALVWLDRTGWDGRAGVVGTGRIRRQPCSRHLLLPTCPPVPPVTKHVALSCRQHRPHHSLVRFILWYLRSRSGQVYCVTPPFRLRAHCCDRTFHLLRVTRCRCCVYCARHSNAQQRTAPTCARLVRAYGARTPLVLHLASNALNIFCVPVGVLPPAITAAYRLSQRQHYSASFSGACAHIHLAIM